ncbi:alpha/beta hydrolase fold family protein [Mycobacterium rhizamassiliense]|jgi:microsomal epoxide hydrolase|uniref:Alpha/beta hydrolase fold family protein n=1 Tax=Mycobacterium rhizamassiliense TaxID=1841860 RepID=A0A2U3NS61_9MYCO|nr:epoxide hydrolase family protein [Mycobacterium rhizamassiliense]SPM34367.1 alpha/beta hydrolase fold family protein [Mycobacterium rhizamassiliense]
MTGPASFPIAVPDSALDDLRRRLDNARWPAELSDSGWDYGTEQAFLRTVVERWRSGYDWRTTESELNEWGSHVMTAAGQRVHLLHARSDDADAIPLVLVHGWPGSIVEFLDALPALRARFHVVVVSMPGYGFSGPTTQRGVDVANVAAAVADVMSQLGYERYVAQGGDWGAIVVRHLGEHYAPRVAAIHTNMLFAPFAGDAAEAMTGVTEGELASIVSSAERLADGTAYMQIQSTRPHSLGFGLDDSPLGLAGWILEKFHAWCDIREGMPVRTDRLIDNLMMYWLTGTATSAARLYCEADRAGNSALSEWHGRVDVPTGYAVYPFELLQTPRVWAESRYNLVHYTVQDRGGHFAAFEQPQLFAADVIAYGDKLRELGVF